ncbi:hypothetical protein Cwoe_0721 [Conexibacter woesei DSM 14684]|uniref:Uncharacterized protein n=1 Tax=Conexibacter woesei (strain DSM 14684 / CCUG 47730 / CIP 108061 / JCM 11494 / NBRC 100937 / ID131577) TaxID=469383 RepID=D3F9I7_CONWI|nr:hypothetical protein Cwoe_0721 [Conexibacter woesei DSM 14684]
MRASIAAKKRTASAMAIKSMPSLWGRPRPGRIKIQTAGIKML